MLGTWIAGVLVVASPALQETDADRGVLRGVVWQADGNRRLAGATVEILEGGALPVARALTDEKGAYELRVAEGRYDARFLFPGRELVAETRRGLEIDSSRELVQDVDLQSFDAALQVRGLSSELFEDEDGDLLPDHVELAAGTRPRESDSDDDGVEDASALWLGVPLRSQALGVIDDLKTPVEGLVLPAGLNVPVPVVFNGIPGATGYAIEVWNANDADERTEETRRFEDGSLVIGEGVALAWTPPAGLGEGDYELGLRALGRPQDHDSAEAATQSFSIEEMDELERIEWQEDTEVSGRVYAESLRVRSGVTVRIPAEKSLELFVERNVVIEADAALFGSDGSSVRIACGGDVVVHGELAAGDGKVATASSRDGGHGGDLEIATNGRLLVSWSGRVASGAGADGLEARAPVRRADCCAMRQDAGRIWLVRRGNSLRPAPARPLPRRRPRRFGHHRPAGRPRGRG